MMNTVLVSHHFLFEFGADTTQQEINQALMKFHRMVKEQFKRDFLKESAESSWCSETRTGLDPAKMNYGRCAICSRWTSDCEKPDVIEELQRGAVSGDRLLCDEHLPSDHPYAF